MAGNDHRKRKIWQFHKSTGAPRRFKTPAALWKAAVSYFEWVEANPLHEQVLVTNRGEWERVDLERPRAMTKESFAMHIGITTTGYRKYKKRPEFADTCAAIDAVIYDQKFTGAAANLFSAVVISRDLGLREKSELSGPGGGPVETVSLDPEQYAKIRQKMMDDDDV